MKAYALAAMAADPAEFRKRVRIDVNGVARSLGEVLDPWQDADFRALDAGWLQAAGRSVPEGRHVCQRGFLERGRGHSKTGDMAVMVAWALTFSPLKLSGIAAASDKDQAGLLRAAIDRLCGLNPWLPLAVHNWVVRNTQTGSELEILSADAASAYGHTPHFVLVDELTHWPDAGQALWDAIFSSVAKRDNALLVVITNAGVGMGASWQWRVRETVREDPSWYFRRLEGPQASWITPAKLDEQRRVLLPMSFARLWLNRWTTGIGDAIDEAEIDAALHGGAAAPLDSPEPGWTYGIGVDLGLKRDNAALVMVGRHSTRDNYKLAYVKSWIPAETGEVDIGEVEAEILRLHYRFRAGMTYMDQWQGAFLKQRLEKANVACDLFYFLPTTDDEMARLVIGLFRDANVALFNHPRLVSELRATSVVEKNNGRLKLHWPRGSEGRGEGHGDHAVAFCLGVMAASEAKSRPATARPYATPAERPAQSVPGHDYQRRLPRRPGTPFFGPPDGPNGPPHDFNQVYRIGSEDLLRAIRRLRGEDD